MITFTQLLGMRPAVFFDAAAELNRSVNALTSGATDYRDQVLRQLESRTFWSDDNTPTAADVSTVLATALETAAANQVSATVALTTLASELGQAQQAARGLREEVENLPGGRLTVVGNEIQERPGLPFPGTSGDPGGLFTDQARLQELVNAVVQRAVNADNAAAGIIERAAGGDFFVTTSGGPGIVARANAARDAAFENLTAAAGLADRLAREAQRDIEEIVRDDIGIQNELGGFVRQLLSNLTAPINIIASVYTLQQALSGDPAAQRQLNENIAGFDLGDLVSADSLREGRIGEFIAANLPLLGPLSRIGAAARLGRGELLSTSRNVVDAQIRSALLGLPGRPLPADVTFYQEGGAYDSGRLPSDVAAASVRPGETWRPSAVEALRRHEVLTFGLDSPFPALDGTDEDNRAAAERIVAEIAFDPRTEEVETATGGHRYVAPDGRAVTVDAQGRVQSFGVERPIEDRPLPGPGS